MLPPPAPSTLNDAIALVRMALDAPAVNGYLSQLAEHIAAYEKAKTANNGVAEALAAREKAVDDKEAGLLSREVAIASREAAAAALSAKLAGQQVDTQAGLQALENDKAKMQQKLESADSAHRSALAAIEAKAGELDTREKALAEKEAAHNARLARLKELV